MGDFAGGPGASGGCLLAHQPDAAAARPALRCLEVRGWPHRQACRASSRVPAPGAVSQGRRAHRGRHSGSHPDHAVAERSKNYRYSTNHQVVNDADTQLVVVVGRPLPGNRNACKAWELSAAKATVGKAAVIADGGYRGTGLVIPHRRAPGQSELSAWKEEHNASHRRIRARVEHAFARMKTWKILRDCRLKGDGVRHAMLGIARLHNVGRRD